MPSNFPAGKVVRLSPSANPEPSTTAVYFDGPAPGPTIHVYADSKEEALDLAVLCAQAPAMAKLLKVFSEPFYDNVGGSRGHSLGAEARAILAKLGVES